MLEGKKISELEPTTKLQRACCFPVLNNGVTRRITYASLLSEIENDLPESEIEQVKDDLEKLQSRAKTSEKRIDDLETETENLKSEFDVVDEMVQGQNATIRNYTTTVEEIERTIENTHFDDVLELEQQVRTNEANIQRNATAIETKQEQLDAEQMEAVNSGITAGKVAQYDTMTSLDELFNLCHPVGEVYVQFPNESAPQTLYGRGTWTEITENYAGNFFRAEGGDSAEFGEVQKEGLPNITGDTGLSVITNGAGASTGVLKNNYKFDSSIVYDGSFISKRGFGTYGISIDANGDIYGKSDHVTPVNTAIKIWKRTA